MAYSPRAIAAMQNRFNKLGAKKELNPAQQRSMDRLGARLGVGQTAPVLQVTRMGPSNPTPGGSPSPLGPAQSGPISGPGAPLPATTPNPAILPDAFSPNFNAPAGGGMGGMKRGGAVKAKKMASGGMTSKSSASRRGDGIAQRGKTKGRML